MYAMDLLRHSIGLRGYAEQDPKIAYKREGTRMFNEMLEQHPRARHRPDLQGADRRPAAGGYGEAGRGVDRRGPGPAAAAWPTAA